MCDPVTLTIAAVAVTAIGTGVTAYGQYSQQRYQGKVADANAKAESAAAADAISRGRMETQAYQQQVARQASQQRAAMAANGLDVTFGSAYETIGDTLDLGQQDSALMMRNAEREGMRSDLGAANQRAEARARRSAATGALVKGAFDIGSTVLGGAQQYNKIQTSRTAGGFG
jgi:hypothetical protein